MAIEELKFRTGAISKTYSTTAALWFVILSLLYFADILLKASRKRFWYDELFTVYLCRLPDFKHTWAAVTQGGDYNPPVLYLLTHGAERIFGEGLIGSRVPEMVSVWIFGICLYLFVARRAGRLSGLVAGLFPFFTTAQYYAYEARPHGITLGWCGLALVCWQRSDEGRNRALWLLGFGLSLTGALLTHVYAVYLVFPFLAVEIYSVMKDRRLNWGMIAAILVPVLAVLPEYIFLLRMYRATIRHPFAPAAFGGFMRTTPVALLADGMVIFLAGVAIFAWGGSKQAKSPGSLPFFPRRELLLATCLACMPLLGVAGAKLSHGPFLPRYFLSAIAGYAIFLGFASARGVGRSWTAGALAGFMIALMVADLSFTVFRAAPVNPLAANATLLNPPEDQDILILQDIEYFYLYQYAPPKVAAHLFFATPSPTNIFLGEYQRLAALTHVDLKATTFAAFLATHKRFLVYGNVRGGGGSAECGDCVQRFLSAGYTLKSAHPDFDGILYEYAK